MQFRKLVTQTVYSAKQPYFACQWVQAVKSQTGPISGNRSGNGWGGAMTPGGYREHSKGESSNLSISSSQSKVADGRNSESLSFGVLTFSRS